MVEYCPNCNAQLPPGLEKCPNCGYRLRSKQTDGFSLKEIFQMSLSVLWIILVPLIIVIGIILLIIYH